MSRDDTIRTLRARWVLGPDGAWIEGGSVSHAHGRVVALAAARGALAGQPVEDLGDVALVPGFVNAHAHLELTGLLGALPRTGPFPGWIRALLAARGARTPQALEQDARAGALRLLATGTTCVGDIDSTGAVLRGLRGVPLRVRRYREVLDAGDPARAGAALAALEADLRRRTRTLPGVSPHAPYTVSAPLWDGLRALLARRRIPVAVHWAETPDEIEWLGSGSGPMAGLLRHAPRRTGLAAIEAAGLLRPRTALIHGNCSLSGERERVAGSGAALVHCPGTHAFFGREPFDARAWLRAGVPLALGTDSLASNADLDLRREMALLRAAQPGLAPREVLALATQGGARAVGLAGRAGILAPGAWADLAAHAVPGRSAAAVEEALTSGASTVRAVWVAGRPCRVAPASADESWSASVGILPAPAQNSPSHPDR